MLLSIGLAGGLAMSLYAFEPIVRAPASLQHYDDLPRRLLRLAHIAAIMLPLINVVLAPRLDDLRLSRRMTGVASWFLLLGAAGLPLSLLAESLVPSLRSAHVSGPAAVLFSVGVFIVTAGACRRPAGTDAPRVAVSHES
ncbi:MAG: hypothetical protein DMD91_28045 [Candidatus Rokuibacteriota bacterium]|nr:MAG: hypothetical protein DMD91_28045 [Candidatus Rokubacteria bacterium]